MRIVTYKTKRGLLRSFSSGALKGYLPAKGFDTNTLEYPVEIEVYDDIKMFRLHNCDDKSELEVPETPKEPETQPENKEEPKVETPVSPSAITQASTKKISWIKKYKWWVVGVSIALVILIIILLIIFLV